MRNSLVTVLLHHKKSCENSHYDWMLAQDHKKKLPLITFRLNNRLDLIQTTTISKAMRIKDHRPLYLEYEGYLPKNLGHIQRKSKGEYFFIEKKEHEWSLQILWESGNLQKIILSPNKKDFDIKIFPCQV